MQEYKEQYNSGNEKMNPDLENKVKSKTTTLSNNPAIPTFDSRGYDFNYEELFAYKRFLDVVEKVKRYTGINELNQSSFMELQRMLMSAVPEIMEIQSQHKEKLERLAVELVVNEMEIPNGAFQYDVKLVGMGEIGSEGFQDDSIEPSDDDIESSFGGTGIPAVEVFNKEKEKRRFINALIQGSAKKGHYMFELVRKQLNQINPQLADLYGVVMSINDLTLWMITDSNLGQMLSQSVSGKEEIDTETIPPTIKAQGIFFPVLIHELIKGVQEVFGTQGLPDDPKSQRMIMDSTDTLQNELWDLRLGVIFWEKFTNVFPISVFEEGNRDIQHYIFARFSALDTDEFFEISRYILSGDERGEKFIEDMVYDIGKDLSERALEDSLSEFDFRIDDDEFEFKAGGQTFEYLFYDNIKFNEGGGVGELQVGDFVTFLVDEKKTIRPIKEIKEDGTLVLVLSKNEFIKIQPEDVIEVKRKETAYDIIIKKIGLPDFIADYVVNTSKKYAVWLADSIKEREIERFRELFSNSDSAGKTDKELLESSKKMGALSDEKKFQNNYSNKITSIIDWLEHHLTPKQNLREMSFDEAYDSSVQWHNQLEIKGGDINYVEPKSNVIIKKYPKDENGIEYYWTLIPSGYCQVDADRMGHCGRTKHESLISLRSKTPLKDDNYISNSHVTIAFGNDGYFYQVLGNKNKKPSKKYHKFIYDLIITLIEDEENQDDKIKQKIEEETKPLIDQKKNTEIALKSVQNQIDERIDEMSSDDYDRLLEDMKLLELENEPINRQIEQIKTKYENSKMQFSGFRSEYETDENYGIKDMTPSQVKQLLDLKPEVIEDDSIILDLYENNLISEEEIKRIIKDNEKFGTFPMQIKLYDLGIIEKRPNTEFTLEADLNDLDRFVDTDISSQTIRDIVSGDYYFDNDGSWGYFYENASDYVDDLNEQNQKEIIQYMIENSDLTEEDIIENGITYYFDIDEYAEEDFVDEIKRSIAESLSTAELSAYEDYYYAQIKGAFEQLGEVVSLNDEGLVLKIDLEDLLLENSLSFDDEYVIDAMERCEDEDENFGYLYCIFQELIGEEIDRPKIFIDDRYTPMTESINEFWDGINY